MATAKLTFKDSAGNVVLEGSDVKSADYKYGDTNNDQMRNTLSSSSSTMKAR
jgi:hypothetical protein